MSVVIVEELATTPEAGRRAVRINLVGPDGLTRYVAWLDPEEAVGAGEEIKAAGLEARSPLT